MIHAYGPSALVARCGAPGVYCSAYAREVTCEACQRLRDGAPAPGPGPVDAPRTRRKGKR